MRNGGVTLFPVKLSGLGVEMIKILFFLYLHLMLLTAILDQPFTSRPTASSSINDCQHPSRAIVQPGNPSSLWATAKVWGSWFCLAIPPTPPLVHRPTVLSTVRLDDLDLRRCEPYVCTLDGGELGSRRDSGGSMVGLPWSRWWGSIGWVREFARLKTINSDLHYSFLLLFFFN